MHTPNSASVVLLKVVLLVVRVWWLTHRGRWSVKLSFELITRAVAELILGALSDVFYVLLQRYLAACLEH